MRALITSRIKLIALLFIIGVVLLVGRLYFVQIVDGKEFSERADRQYRRPNQTLYDRGNIFFTDKEGGRFSAATLKLGYTVAISPKNIVDTNDVYLKINEIIELDADSFYLKANKKDDPYEEIALKVPEEKALAIEALGLQGVGIYKERWRFYPGEESASHVLGFVGFKGDELTGRYGLEQYYNNILSRDSNSNNLNFFAEIFSNIKEVVSEKEILVEGDLITTIEPKVQTFLEQTLQKIQDEYSSELSGGIIIDPKNGDVYALSIKPGFNLNSYGKVTDVGIFTNSLIESVYEMGSIIKPITIASGLDSETITAETTYDDKGYLMIDGKTISNFDGKGRGVVEMQEVLSQSLNTGVAFVVNKMGKDKFREYLFKFGLNEKTGIDLPNESSALIDNLNSPRDLEYATASFGQGIAMTPIMTVRALSALANGGLLIRPHIVQEIDYKVGLKDKIEPEIGSRAISETSSDEITRMLVKVVDEALAEGNMALPNYSVAAKTGTAQIASPNGGYYDDRFLHSFFGYFPAYNPKFLVFLYTVYPKEVRYASQTLTTPFFDLTKFLISYYEIAPDR